MMITRHCLAIHGRRVHSRKAGEASPVADEKENPQKRQGRDVLYEEPLGLF